MSAQTPQERRVGVSAAAGMALANVEDAAETARRGRFFVMMFRARFLRARSLPALLSAASLLLPRPLHAADLVRGVRGKLSAADLASGEAAVEEYRREHGTDRKALDALGWLARGAVMLGHPEKAAAFAAEVRRGIPAESSDLLVPLGAAIEVESKLTLAAEGRGAALRFLDAEYGRARETALRSRIRKNINLLTLEGEKAPPLGGADPSGEAAPRLAELAGRPVPVDTETMVRYGVSATPTYALLDADGTVRLYAPTRLSESELSRRIEESLARR